MGYEFFWFYDLILVAVIIAALFNGIKKGAVAVIISAVAAIVGFIVSCYVVKVRRRRLYWNTTPKTK